jgi:hypothetical protein
VGHFSFECCPLVREINSAFHYLPSFGRWLITVFFYRDISTGGLFLCPTPFLWGRFSMPTTPSASVLDCSPLFVFQFCEAVQFWMLLSASVDQLCNPLQLCFREWLIANLLSAFAAFPVFIY